MMTARKSEPGDFVPPSRAPIALTWALLAGAAAFGIGILLAVVVRM